MKSFKFLLVTGVSLFFLLAYTSLCQAIEQTVEPLPPAGAIQPFVYLTVPHPKQALVQQPQLEALQIQVIDDTAQFSKVLQDPQIKAIYIHPEAFLLLQPELLEKAFNRGVVLVALNTPISYLTKSVHTQQSMPDLNFAYANGRLAVAIVAKIVKPDGGGEGLYSNFFERFEDIAHHVQTDWVDFDPAEVKPSSANNTPEAHQSWADPSGGILLGSSTIYKEGSFWKSKATSAHSFTAYYLRSAIVVVSHCDYPHEIFRWDSWNYNITTISTPAGVVGPCSSPAMVVTTSTHKGKRYNWTGTNFFFGGDIQESKVLPGG